MCDSFNLLNSQLKRQLEELERANQDLMLSENAMKGELSVLRSELTSIGIEESRISDELIGLKRDANDLLLSKTKTLEAENVALQDAIDLMRSELIDMNTNEKGLITKMQEIDAQNKSLLEEASSQQNEALFYKDKSRKLEIQLNQAIGNERVFERKLSDS